MTTLDVGLDALPLFPPASPPGLVPEPGPKHAHYRSGSRLGGGAFGEVLAGHRLATGEPVALKRVVVAAPERGLPDNLLRELKTLQHLAGASPHVVELLDHYAFGNALVLVLEPCFLGDLRGLLSLGDVARDPEDASSPPSPSLTLACAKGLVRQILLGVAACHARGVLHRDVKPGNVLVLERRLEARRLRQVRRDDARRRRLLEDRRRPGPGAFGRTRTLATGRFGSPDVRDPDAVVSSAGDFIRRDVVRRRGGRVVRRAILGELLGDPPGAAILPGESDVDQLARTLRMLGTPSDTRWPGATRMPDYEKIRFEPREPLEPRDAFAGANRRAATREGARALEYLFSALLVLDPGLRAGAEKAAEDSFFVAEAPAPLAPAEAAAELLGAGGLGLRGGGGGGGGGGKWGGARSRVVG